jgi:hyperosmotically inducible periplasmic protein
MKHKMGIACVVLGCFLAPMTTAYADDVDAGHPMNYVKDSAITSLIKTKLATEHLTSLKNIKVDTDDKGVVWLSGSASTQFQVDKAESVARGTDGVRAVKNHIVVRTDG